MIIFKMYEDSESCGPGDASINSSPSLINNLRGFRFQKKVVSKLLPNGVAKPAVLNDAPSSSFVDDSPCSAIAVQPRKKVRRIEISDEEDEPNASSQLLTSMETETVTEPVADASESPDEVLSLEETEKRLRFLRDAFPQMDLMVLQDKLLYSDWDVDAAMASIVSPVKNNQAGGSLPKRERRENNQKRHKKKSRRKFLSDGDSSDEAAHYKDRSVFDSSDSEQELDEPSDEQKKVLEFLSTATDGELSSMPNCSAKKVPVIVRLRPFKNWRDLVEKLQGSKGLTTDLLASAQECLRSRVVVDKLMKQCVKLATQMETAVKAGVTHITSQPTNLNSSLRLAGYQLVGLNWLITMHEQGLNGILADEMGLGKTVQVIALLAHLQEVGYERVGPHLVVVPSSTLDNWKNEFARWCPSLNVVVYHGSQEDRQSTRINWNQYGKDDVDVILTTYNLVATSPMEKKLFRTMGVDYLILDEAHMLKNMATLRYENLMRISAEHRVLLTGTPLQNTLLELMSLLIFVMPHMFSGKKDYLKSLFARAPTMTGDGKVKPDMPQFEQSQVAQARRIMAPFVMRRLKRDVLKDLPTKTDQTVVCPMADLQKQQYADLMRSYSKDTQVLDTNPTTSMTMMMQLRKLANHPALLQNYFTNKQLNQMATYLMTDPFYKATVREHVLEDLTWMSDFEIHQMSKTYKSMCGFKLPESVIVESGKFRQLDEVLPRLKAGGHRVLIFSQFVIMLNVMEEYLRIRKHKFVRLDGQTAVTIRQDLIDEFNRDNSIFIFLLSTKAGGLGINLTAADTVIIHDIDFNPYNDKQAEDRCHRLGQTRNVTVMRLLSEDTIEEGIYQVAQQKLHLEREINSEDGPSESKSVVQLLKQALGLEAKTFSPMKSS